MSAEKNKVTIVGGGPAGLAAAIYTARAGFSTIVFAGSPPGGQLTLTSEVENFPGVPHILGPELISTMRKQAESFGAKIYDSNILSLDLKEKNLQLESGSSVESVKKITTDVLIIATGAKALWLEIPSETRLRGKGVSACATCDGFFFRGKTVAVVGGGDTAMEEALTLTNFASKVYLIHRRDSFRASKIMQDRVLNHEKIEVIFNSSIEEIKGENFVTGISVENNTGEKRDIELGGVFIAIGHKPDTDIFKGQIELDEKGYILTHAQRAMRHLEGKITLSPTEIENARCKSAFETKTNREAVFAAGDCVDYVYRQAGTASGMGIMAAIDAARYLEMRG